MNGDGNKFLDKYKKQSNLNPRDKRLQALHKLISLEKSTSKAIPFSEWKLSQKLNIYKFYFKLAINFSISSFSELIDKGFVGLYN